jgi:CheY-like chemotaxis protein
VDTRTHQPVGESPSHTVLLVEDDETFSYATSRYLRSKGYNVIVAPGSMAALRELEKGGIDLVVTDVELLPNEHHQASRLGLATRLSNDRTSGIGPRRVFRLLRCRLVVAKRT